MLYEFKINGVSQSGNPKVSFSCAHCGLIDFYMGGYLYAAKLSKSPRENIEAACQEFVDRINYGDFNLFINPKTANKITYPFDYKAIYHKKKQLSLGSLVTIKRRVYD